MGAKGRNAGGTPGVIGVVITKTLVTFEPYMSDLKAIYHWKAYDKTELSTS